MAQPVVVLDSDLGFFGNGSEVTDKLLPVLPTMPVDGEDENGTESIITTDHEEFIATTYTIVLPLIASVGIVGNLLIVVVLVRHNFQGFIYTYIKSLALTDLCYLIFTMQAAWLSAEHYLLFDNYRNPEGKPLTVYIWNFMSPMWHVWATASNFIIVSMTMDRFLIMRRIDRVSHRTAAVRSKEFFSPAVMVVFAVFFTFVFHFHYFFQFFVVPCNNVDSGSHYNASLGDPAETPCYTPIPSKLARSGVWNPLCYINLGATKLAPYCIVAALNVAMLIKLRRIWKQRKRIRKGLGRGQPTTPLASGGEGSGETSSHARQKPKKTVEIATISSLLVNPPSILGYEEHMQLTSFQRMKLKFTRPKKKRRKILMFTLPSKSSIKEIRLTLLLLSIVLSHILLTLASNVINFIWTIFPKYWSGIADRVIYESVGDIMCCINYSMNFYLYCLTNKEIREAVIADFRKLFLMEKTASLEGNDTNIGLVTTARKQNGTSSSSELL